MINNDIMLNKIELLLGQDRKQQTVKMVEIRKVENILTQKTLLVIDVYDKVASFTTWMGKLVLLQCGRYENIILKLKALVDQLDSFFFKESFYNS